MSELSPRARVVLDSADVGVDPRTEDKRRVKAALLAQIGAPVVDTSGADGLGDAIGATGGTAKGLGAGATVLKATLSLAVLGAGAFGLHIMTKAPESVSPPSASAAIVEHRAPPRAEPAPSISTSPQESPVFEPPDQERVPSRLKASPSSPAPAKTKTSPAQVTTSTIEAERKLLRHGRALLRNGDPRAALGVAVRHRREFATGTLSQERDVLEVLALCDLGKKELGRKKASVFRANHPSSPLLLRLEGTCRD